MAGVNPYIKKLPVNRPTKPYTVTFIDEAPALTPDSRLSCQCVPDGSADVVVVVPRWNRNQVKEADH